MLAFSRPAESSRGQLSLVLPESNGRQAPSCHKRVARFLRAGTLGAHYLAASLWPAGGHLWQDMAIMLPPAGPAIAAEFRNMPDINTAAADGHGWPTVSLATTTSSSPLLTSVPVRRYAS